MIPFECDICIFRNLRRGNPKDFSPCDQLLLLCIQIMNLDAFWSSESSTVRANKGKVAQILGFSGLVGLRGPFDYEGPYPDYDYCGYEVFC